VRLMSEVAIHKQKIYSKVGGVIGDASNAGGDEF